MSAVIGTAYVNVDVHVRVSRINGRDLEVQVTPRGGEPQSVTVSEAARIGLVEKLLERGVETVHAAICEESLDDCLEYRGRCVRAVEALHAAEVER